MKKLTDYSTSDLNKRIKRLFTRDEEKEIESILIKRLKKAVIGKTITFTPYREELKRIGYIKKIQVHSSDFRIYAVIESGNKNYTKLLKTVLVDN